MIQEVIFSITLLVSLDIAKISDVPRHILRSRMCVTEWVIVRTSGDASLQQVSILMNMESVLFTSCQSSELGIDFTESICTSLAKVDDTFCNLIWLRVQYANGFPLHVGLFKLTHSSLGSE